MYLMPLNYTLKIVKMAKFNDTHMLPHICVHTYKKTLPNVGEDGDNQILIQI